MFTPSIYHVQFSLSCVKGRNEDAPQKLKDTYGEFYKENELISILYKNNIHGITHLSLFEESYCYALTTSINSGIPILYLEHGVFTERLKDNNKYYPTNLSNFNTNFESSRSAFNS